MLFGVFFFASSWCFVHMETGSFAGLPVMYKTWVIWCASYWARPLGVVWFGHYFHNLLGECLAAHKFAYQFFELFQVYGGFMHEKSYVLALAGQPSLHGYDACMIYWAKGALRRNCGQKYGKTSFSPFLVFLLSRNSRVRFWAWFFGIFGLVGPGTLGQLLLLSMFVLRFSMLGGGGLTGI